MENQRLRLDDFAPALVRACAELARTLSEIHRAVVPSVIALSDTLRRTSEAVAPYLQAFARFSQTVDAVNATGWVPHRSLPLGEVLSLSDDVPRLDTYIDAYYEKHWIGMRQDITSRLSGYAVDDETKATFEEAFEAHENGHYRCVCRVLFPEIERMIRSKFNVVEIGESLSRRKIGNVLNGTTLKDVIAGDPLAYSRFRLLAQHVYERVEDEDLERVERESTPNRHAALHGLVTYSTKKHSINTILISDFMLELFSSIDPSRVQSVVPRVSQN